METVLFDYKTIEGLADNLAKLEKYTFNEEAFQKFSNTFTRFSEALVNIMNSKYVISYKNVIENLGYNLEKLAKGLSKYDCSLFIEEFIDFSKKIEISLSDLEIEQLKDFSHIDIDRFNLDLDYQNKKYCEVRTVAYDIANKQNEVTEEKITEADLQEAYNKKEEIGFQEWFYNKSEEFKKKYYIYSLFIDLFKFVIGTILAFYIGVALAKGSVKEQPGPKATIIYNIVEETNVMVIGNLKYYYQVIFEDENGNEVIGYIAKRNVKLSSTEENVSDIEK